MIKVIVGTVLLVAAFCAVGYLGLSRLPDSEVFVDSDGQCLFVDTVINGKWTRIECTQFDFRQEYITRPGGRP